VAVPLDAVALLVAVPLDAAALLVAVPVSDVDAPALEAPNVALLKVVFLDIGMPVPRLDTPTFVVDA